MQMMSRSQRKHTRYQVNARVQGELVGAEADHLSEASIIDVSSRGIGVTVDRPFDAGARATLMTLSHAISFRVKWCSRATEKGKFRCGLEPVDHNADICAAYRHLVP